MFLLGHGILGVNARNQKYLRSPKKTRRVLDSKLLTKKVLREKKLPVLETLAIIRTRKELLNFNWEDLPKGFALKPNRGLGGEGIIVVYGKKIDTYEPIWTPSIHHPTWIKADGSLIAREEIESHILNVLDGNFSLFSLPDVAFFEERAKVAKELKPYSWKGIPDVRVIIFEGVPIMAMLRLPTPESKGRANLHQGAIGVGIDLATGRTSSAIYHHRFIDYYPATRYLLRGIKIPYFKKILNLAVLAQKAVKMKFLGVDITINKERGPVILELNARPGLSIQLANLAGLEERLKRVKGLKLTSEERGTRLSQDLFGENEEEADEEIFGKKILGPIEEVEIIVNRSDEARIKLKEERTDGRISNKNSLSFDKHSGEQRYKTLAKIDTGAWRSVISFEVAKELNINYDSREPDLLAGQTIRKVKSSLGGEERIIMPLSFVLAGEKIETEVYLADRSSMKYEILIGRRDLKNFIIDPSKNVTSRG